MSDFDDIKVGDKFVVEYWHYGTRPNTVELRTVLNVGKVTFGDATTKWNKKNGREWGGDRYAKRYVPETHNPMLDRQHSLGVIEDCIHAIGRLSWRDIERLSDKDIRMFQTLAGRAREVVAQREAKP